MQFPSVFSRKAKTVQMASDARRVEDVNEVVLEVHRSERPKMQMRSSWHFSALVLRLTLYGYNADDVISTVSVIVCCSGYSGVEGGCNSCLTYL